MATQLFRFLGEGLGFYARATNDQISDNSNAPSYEEKRDCPVEPNIEKSTFDDKGVVEQLLQVSAPAKPPEISRSISETLYEDMGRIHSMYAVRKALDTSGRNNPMHARRILEQNPLDCNRYCCIKIQQDGPKENFELECSLCYTEFDADDKDLMRLPCGLEICRTCLQVRMTRYPFQCCLV